MTAKKPKIEAIYPLSTIQQGLLFHHLMEGEDQGFLTVQCVIEGNLDIERLKLAWQFATNRHEVMRTSVHWEKVEKPILVVRPEKEIEWSFLDWRNTNQNQQAAKLEVYKSERKKDGVAFEKNPLSKISIIQTTENSYHFLWECHHLLLDGWSSAIIIRDAFAFYEQLSSETIIELPSIPNQKSYNSWLKSNSIEDAKNFWSKTFNNFTEASLFQQNAQVSLKPPVAHHFNFSEQISGDLKKLAKSYKVTLNTLFQGVWSLALTKCFNKEDITFGNTVSGRSIPFPNINLMAGMFANVLPVRAKLDASNSFQTYLQAIQSQQQEARNYEYSKIDQIVSWANLPEEKPLFDSLFVFENFPWEDMKSGEIQVKSFKSGITSTYPITAIFKIEKSINYELLVNTDVVPNSVVDWFLDIVPNICNLLLEKKDININDILEKILVVPPAFLKQRFLQDIQSQEEFQKKEVAYVAPRNQVELKLVEIWEQLFGINLISITDSFFFLGGKSLLSVKMFTLIEDKLSVKLSPTTLLESPTIKQLAEIISSKGDKNTTSWKYLVPIKIKGKKAPLFCIHAGGGHVFFYKALADAIDVEKPVYAIQPLGIFGEEDKHLSIQQMAKDYADEISLVQPEGTIHIIVYCFSTAVGLEMASYLKFKGRETHLIVADTIAEHRLLLDKERLFIRVSAFLKRFFSNPFKALNKMIGFRILFYVKPLKIKLFGNEAEKNTEKMRLHLVSLFNAYEWKTKIDNVSLVLTEKGDKRYNQEIERSWKPLVKEEIKIKVCKGNHNTFFENPDVIDTANAIDKVILEQ
ncbi:MAG: condensation domain-containing protein [Polaribacter sp.]